MEARSSLAENSMKYFTIVLLFLPLVTMEGTVDRKHLQEMYEQEMARRKEKLLLSVMWTETRMGLITETPTSKREKAVGILQIRPGMVQFLNMYGYEFKLSDRNDSLKSTQMFFAFQDMINPEYDFEYGCHIWNAGHNRVEERWNLTENYRRTAYEYKLRQAS